MEIILLVCTGFSLDESSIVPVLEESDLQQSLQYHL